MDAGILRHLWRVFLAEIAVSGLNYFVLMRRVYEPRWGELRAHRIGMTTRIVYIFGFAWVLDRSAHLDHVGGYLLTYLLSPLVVGLAFQPAG